MTSVIQPDVVNSSNKDSKIVDNSNDKQAEDLLSKINPSSYKERPNYSKIDFSSNKWLMSYDEASLSKLENPPSLADGISLELEKDHFEHLYTDILSSHTFLYKKNISSVVFMSRSLAQADIEIVEGELKKEKQQTVFKDLLSKINPSSYKERPNYSKIDFSSNKWLMSYDEASLSKLENPPSLADGISLELEKDIRYLGCELIQTGAILLKLSQTAAATSQILFQRFYYQKSFVNYNFEHMLCACLFLASKIEEQPRMPTDVINVYHRLKQLYQHRRKISSGGGDVSNVNPQHLRPKDEDLAVEKAKIFSKMLDYKFLLPRLDTYINRKFCMRFLTGPV
uniref:Cyclin-like domain-containing protein n=1 Tax=Meloidogyne incognita TaxID=6306 RepID=A0A914N6A9_MELIC